MTRKQTLFFAGLIPLICIGLDQLSKLMILQFFAENYGSPMDVCADENFGHIRHEVSRPMDITLSCNRGVSFGMFSSAGDAKRWILSGFAIIVSLFLVWVIKTSKDRLSALSFGLIIGGSIGNVIDRVRYGAVVDFFDFTGIHFPGIFNVADSFICIGVAGMIYASFFIKPDDEAA